MPWRSPAHAMPGTGFTAATFASNQRRWMSRRVEETVLGISQDSGRTIDVKGGGLNYAMMRLRDVVEKAKLREITRRNTEFEKPHDKRRRKLAEKEHRYYLRVMRERVRLAYNLKRRLVSGRCGSFRASSLTFGPSNLELKPPKETMLRSEKCDYYLCLFKNNYYIQTTL